MKKKVSIIVAVLTLISIMVMSLASCQKQYKIGVQNGTTGHGYLEDLLGKGNKSIEGYEQYAQALQKVQNGDLKAVLMDGKPAKESVKHVKGLKVIENVTKADEFVYGVSKKSVKLLEELDKFLDVKNEEIQKIESQNQFTYHTIRKVNIPGDNDIVMATETGFAPYEMKKGEKYAGIDVEIGLLFVKYINENEAVKTSLGFKAGAKVEFKIKEMEFDSIVTEVQKDETGKMIAMAGLSKTPDREKVLAFTKAYDENKLALVVKEGDKTFDGIDTTEGFQKKIKELTSKKK